MSCNKRKVVVLNTSLQKNIPPKGMIFWILIAIFVMWCDYFYLWIRNAKTSVISNMTKIPGNFLP